MVLAATLILPTLIFASSIATVPVEIDSAAPKGSRLIAFVSSGDQSDADAVAIFEGSTDNAGIRNRVLMTFGKKNGVFQKNFTSEKLIACSLCSQFHDDPFRPRHVKVTPGHIHIDQFDSGEKPSSTVIELNRQNGVWRVTSATRSTVVAGRGDERKETLPFPPSGLAKDMDARWSVPVFFNTIIVKKSTGKFFFVHRSPNERAAWEALKDECTNDDCTVLVQQGDGCISLVKDVSGHSYGGTTPDTDDEKGAAARAIATCESAGGYACKEVRTDCSKGI